jgi:hypothetical protein
VACGRLEVLPAKGHHGQAASEGRQLLRSRAVVNRRRSFSVARLRALVRRPVIAFAHDALSVEIELPSLQGLLNSCLREESAAVVGLECRIDLSQANLVLQ